MKDKTDDKTLSSLTTDLSSLEEAQHPQCAAKNSLIHNNKLTRDIYRSSLFENRIGEAVGLRTVVDVPFDVKHTPHTLRASTKSKPVGGDFSGLSCSVVSGRRLSSLESLVRVDKHADCAANMDDIEEADQIQHGTKLPEGTPINSSDFIVDHDRAGHPDHVILALARDTTMIKYHHNTRVIEVEQLTKLPWVPCEDVEVVSMLEPACGSCSVTQKAFKNVLTVPDEVHTMLNEMLRRGTDEDVDSVLDLIAMLEQSTDTFLAHQLECLQLAYHVLSAFFYSEALDYSERDGDIVPLHIALCRLNSLIEEATKPVDQVTL
eukprot:gene26115-32646_t